MKPPLPLFSLGIIRHRVLNLSAGNGAVWFGERPTNIVAVDKRPTKAATVLADTTALPFADDSFDLACFDPPHVNVGAGSYMTARYGHSTTDEIRKLVAGTSAEASRVIIPSGWLAMKWNDHAIPLVKILGLMPHWRPLFGHHVAHRNKHASTTTWLLLANTKALPPPPLTAYNRRRARASP